MAEQTTKTITDNIAKLVKLRDSLIQVVEDSSNTKELNQRFMQLSNENQDDFELLQTLMLMQDISSTYQKNFKSSMINYISIITNSKIESYQELEKLNQRIKTLEIEKGTQLPIPILGKVPLKDFVFFLVMVFTIVMVSYIVNPEATKSSLNVMSDTTKSKVGVK